MRTIYFIRHGQTDTHERNTKIYQGHGMNLSPLTEVGRNQIKHTALDPLLKDSKLILSSPYTRTLQSAAILSKELNLDILVETDLHEWVANKNYLYEDKETADLYYQEYNQYHGIYPDQEKNWESASHIKKRVLAVLEKYKQFDSILVVAHGMLIQAVTGSDHPDNGEIIEYQI